MLLDQPYIPEIAAIAPIIASLITAFVVWYTSRAARQITRVNSDKLDDIHILVNSRLTNALTKISELESELSHVYGQHAGDTAAAAARITDEVTRATLLDQADKDARLRQATEGAPTPPNVTEP